MENKIMELENIKILKISGRVRLSTQDNFKSVLEKFIKDHLGEYLVLDFSGLEYMNSAGLGIIIDAYKRNKAADGNIVVCNLDPNIKELFEVTKLNTFIKIYDNEKEAVKNQQQ